MRRHGWFLACGVVAMFAAAPAFAQTTPSLGDLARQAEKERSATRKAVKTYTNADLTPDPRAQTPPPAAEKPVGGFVSKSTGEVVSPDEIVANSQNIIASNTQNMGEDHWRLRAATVGKQLEKAQADVQSMATAPPARTAAMRELAVKELEKMRKNLATLEKRWQELEDSAHFAKVPPAWLQPR